MYTNLAKITFSLASSSFWYGRWKGSQLVKFVTFKLSKNLSNININFAVSSASGPPVNLMAFPTDSLRTYIYNSYENVNYNKLVLPDWPASWKMRSNASAHTWALAPMRALTLFPCLSHIDQSNAVIPSFYCDISIIYKILLLYPTHSNRFLENHQFLVVLIRWGGSEKER